MPSLLGLWVGARRALLATLQERAERVEREQHVMAEQAKAQERARIAREMHDVVAHRVSLMVLHAARWRPRLPTRPRYGRPITVKRLAGTVTDTVSRAVTRVAPSPYTFLSAIADAATSRGALTLLAIIPS